jgi:hypothetical protein
MILNPEADKWWHISAPIRLLPPVTNATFSERAGATCAGPSMPLPLVHNSSNVAE